MSQAGSLNSSGSGGSGVQTLTGNTGGPVSGSNINVVGTGSISVAGNPGTSTLTISSSGGGGGITTIDGDSGSMTGSTVTVSGGTTGLTTTAATSTMDLTGTLNVVHGGTAATSFNTNGVVISGATTTTALQSLSLTDGQIVIGSSIGAPAAATLTAGSGVTITNGHNSISIASTGGTFYSITPYIVGTDANSQYSTIQAAITQAVSDGASDSTPKNIYIKPGTYTETLTGHAGIRIIGLSIPALGSQSGTSTLWNGVCTWASGEMGFENIQTSYSGSGTIFTIPTSGKLFLQGCKINNPGSAGTIVADSGTGCNLYFNDCQPGNNVGVLLHSTHTGFVGQFSNSYIVGSVSVVGGTWTLTNCNMGASWNIGNTESYTFIANAGSFTDQFTSSSNTQFGNSLQCYDVNFSNSGTQIQSGKCSIQIINCFSSAGANTIVDDSVGPGGSSITFTGGNFSSATNLVFLGAASTYSARNVNINSGDFITNSATLSPSFSNGFLSIPSCNGTPVSIPTVYGGSIPIVLDTSTNTIFGYNGSWVPLPPAPVLSITPVTNGDSPYTVLSTDQFLSVDVSGGPVSILLPDSPSTSRVIIIKDTTGGSATNNISVTTVGGTVTVDGQTTYTILDNYESINVIFDGTNYQVF